MATQKSDWAHLAEGPSYPLTYINLHYQIIWKQSDKDFLSYRANDEDVWTDWTLPRKND